MCNPNLLGIIMFLGVTLIKKEICSFCLSAFCEIISSIQNSSITNPNYD